MSKQTLTRETLLKNLRAMKMGTRLLKFGTTGKVRGARARRFGNGGTHVWPRAAAYGAQPDFRVFRLTADNEYITWESQKKEDPKSERVRGASAAVLTRGTPRRQSRSRTSPRSASGSARASSCSRTVRTSSTSRSQSSTSRVSSGRHCVQPRRPR
jgi:hypothetical protein